MKKRTIHAADLFCGAGGTSTGLLHACRRMGYELKLLAINHWDVAIKTHAENHPYAQHLCESLDNVDPRKVVPSGRLDILIAAPECTHHSNARGGKPMSDQSRSTAWAILRWAEALYIDNILIENVRELRTWGPLGADGRPIKRLKGQTYVAFLTALRSLGYSVEERILNAANYGDPTTRERLFIMARRGRRRPIWPEPTHAAANGNTEMYAKLKPWRAAREVIDWSIKSQSIFSRKRPLAAATLARIEAGLRRFGGANAEPFLVILRNHCGARSVNEPVPTLTARGRHVALCEPFMLGQQSGGAPRSVRNPVPTVSTGGAIALIEPFILPQRSDASARSIERPLQTVTTTSRGIAPFFGERNGQEPRTHSVGEPLPTVTSHGAGALVEPFLCKYNGTAKARPVSVPLDTVTTKDRFALVETEQGPAKLDIRFRMLTPKELARAMSFEDSYRFTGTKELQIKQIGNAVPVRTASALCEALLA